MHNTITSHHHHEPPTRYIHGEAVLSDLMYVSPLLFTIYLLSRWRGITDQIASTQERIYMPTIYLPRITLSSPVLHLAFLLSKYRVRLDPNHEAQLSGERCRKRKIKCDLTQPCSRCSKAKVDCLYIGTGEKRRLVPNAFVQINTLTT